MTQKDPNDKYAKYKVPYGTNETHAPDEWDPLTEGKISDPSERQGQTP